MHESELADKTIARALEIGALCKEFRCEAIVHNPNTKPAQVAKPMRNSPSRRTLSIAWAVLSPRRASSFASSPHRGVGGGHARVAPHPPQHRPEILTLCLDLEHSQHAEWTPMRSSGRRDACKRSAPAQQEEGEHR